MRAVSLTFFFFDCIAVGVEDHYSGICAHCEKRLGILCCVFLFFCKLMKKKLKSKKGRFLIPFRQQIAFLIRSTTLEN